MTPAFSLVSGFQVCWFRHYRCVGSIGRKLDLNIGLIRNRFSYHRFLKHKPGWIWFGFHKDNDIKNSFKFKNRSWLILDLIFLPDIGMLWFTQDVWIMIDIYLMSINQLLVQRCGETKCNTRVVLTCFRHEIITRKIVFHLWIFAADTVFKNV